MVRVVPIAAGRQDIPHCHAMALRWLFLASLLLYVLTAGSNFTSGDAYAELRVAQSLADHGWFDEPASPKCTPGSGYGEPGSDGRCYATHGIGYSLLLLPAYLLAKGAIAAFSVPYCDTWTYCVPIHLVSWTTCLVSALILTLLCGLCLDLGYSLRRSLLASLLYGFAGMAWPYARYGFDVTPTALFMLAAARQAILASRSADGSNARAWFLAGLCCATAVVIRLPTAAAVLPLGAYVVFSQRGVQWRSALRAVVAFGLPLAAALLWSAWYNAVRFGGLLNDGHTHNGADSLSATPWLGIVGMLISSGKGILWYCPVTVLALVAAAPFFRRFPAICVLCLTTTLFSIIPYTLVRDWYGGDAWGPRFLVPVLPLLLLPLAELPPLFTRHPLRAVLAVLAGLAGVVIALAGQLVSYPERLHLAAKAGAGDRILWDPRYSPIGDHLPTLWKYLTHLDDATRTTGEGASSFDIWWLNLWRNDQVPAVPTGAAAAIALVLALVAVAGLVQTVRACDDRVTMA